MGCHFLLQGIFPIQGLNLCLLHWQVDSLLLSHQGSSQKQLYPSQKKSYFWIQSHSEVLGVNTSTYEFWRGTIRSWTLASMRVSFYHPPAPHLGQWHDHLCSCFRQLFMVLSFPLFMTSYSSAMFHQPNLQVIAWVQSSHYSTTAFLAQTTNLLKLTSPQFLVTTRSLFSREKQVWAL